MVSDPAYRDQDAGRRLVKANMATLEEMSKMAEFSLDDFVVNWADGHPAFQERLANHFGFVTASVFEAARQKAEAELSAERQKTIQKFHLKGWTDTEIAEFMELDLKTIQTYIAPAV
jgi:DNA-binding NarL/FixJ family response regulator